MLFHLTCILLIISSLAKTPNTDFCQKIICDSGISQDKCIKVDNYISIMNPCPDNKECDTFTEDPTFDSYCVDKKISNFKKLPSLPCNSNEECLSGQCSDSKTCIGIKEGQTCNLPSDCEYGLTCRIENTDKKCLKPLNEGEQCQAETDCTNNCGCMNGKCAKYFSLNDFEETGGSDYYSDLTFCKSGYVNEVGKCMNLFLKNEITECSDDNPCEYIYYDVNYDEKIVVNNKNCLCGYNPFGKKYCLLGSGNSNYTKYLNIFKNYYLNNPNCHSSERHSNGCQKDIISGSQQVKELIHARYWAKANNRLIDAPECVYKVELPDYDRSIDRNIEPTPLPEGKCAKYTCKETINGGICANSFYPDPFNIQINLADVCTEGAKCNLDGEPNAVFYNKSNTQKTCILNNLNKRYPGEKCQIDSECIYPLNNPSTQFHNCVKEKCTGIDKGGICEDNSWCLVGLYCDKKEGKCKKQNGKDKECLDSKECKNDLVCVKGKCADLFSLEDGEDVPANEDVEFQKKFCKSMEVMNNKCVSYNDINQISDEQYQTCEYGTFCEYKVNGLGDGIKKYVQCGCGYNEQGQGYCPHYHDHFTDDWEEYRKIWIDESDNDCHTESRFHCYEFEDEEESKLKTYRNKLENGHLFFNCVPCANKVLSGNYIFDGYLKYILISFMILFI